jgi:uncharacterized protein (DUF58 family)
LRSSWGIFILWALALVFALGTGRRLAFNVLYFITGVIVVALFWTLANVRGLSLKRVSRSQRSQVGKYFEESLEIANGSRWPKLWVEVQDFSTLPGHHISKVVNGLGRRQTAIWQVRTLCQQRGRFILGPLSYTSGDPLGIFRITHPVNGVTSLVVTPAAYPIPEFSPPSGYLPGSETTRRRTPYITASVSGVRDYAPGDGFNRIHWRSTARTGRLMSKEFELDPLADVWVFLDLHEEAQAASPWTPETQEPLAWVVRPRSRADRFELPPSTEEYGVTIAASLAQHFLQLDREVGFLSYATAREVIQPDRGDRQLSRLLEVLAVIQARGHIPLAQVLATEGAHLARHTTLVVITPSADPRWVSALRGLRARGVQGVGVLLAARTFGPAPDWQPVQAELQASGLPSYLVRRGDDLAVALSQVSSSSPRRYGS